MECPEFLAIVSGEREEDLTLEESFAFESHAETCGACSSGLTRAQRELDEDRERFIALMDPPVLAASAWARVDEAVQLEARRPVKIVDLPNTVWPGGSSAQAAGVVVPAQPQAVLGQARRGGMGLALVAASFVAAFLVIAQWSPPSAPPRDTTTFAIGRVDPPEEGAVRVKQIEFGKDYQGSQEIDNVIIMLRDQ